MQKGEVVTVRKEVSISWPCVEGKKDEVSELPITWHTPADDIAHIFPGEPMQLPGDPSPEGHRVDWMLVVLSAYPVPHEQQK